MTLEAPNPLPDSFGVTAMEMGGIFAISPQAPDRYGDRSTEGEMTIRWVDNRHNESKPKSIPLNLVPMGLTSMKFHRLGMYITRSYEITMMSNVPGIVVYLEEEIEVLNSYATSSSAEGS